MNNQPQSRGIFQLPAQSRRAASQAERAAKKRESSHILTLPDYLRPGLQLVFVGLNPGMFSAQNGKYYARATNRFWPALSASGLAGGEVRAGDETILFDKGIGFTDVVKRATGQINELTRDEIVSGVKMLRQKIATFSPRVACFVGLTGFRWVFEVSVKTAIKPGLQDQRIASTLIYVLPSTSAANAHYPSGAIVTEFHRLKSWLASQNIRFT